jgi:hypothetical protein
MWKGVEWFPLILASLPTPDPFRTIHWLGDNGCEGGMAGPFFRYRVNFAS